MKTKKINVFYTPKQVCTESIQEKSYSKSPLKPKLLMQYLIDHGFGEYLQFCDDFPTFGKKDFLLAHTLEYVNDFFEGGRLSVTNGLPWSRELVDSVGYTNSSLYHAIKHACENPDTITFSPTSGFHHATPNAGMGFCTFSGQVIASLKLYQEKGLRGAYLDLDGHFGNSIPNSSNHFPEVNQAIVMNINPQFSHEDYLIDFKRQLNILSEKIKAKEVDYVVWCHGADSHEWDDLGHQCSTEEWIECSRLFYTRISELENELGIQIPITLSLFGGYRKDDYKSVLSLHATDLKSALEILTGQKINYTMNVNPRKYHIDLVSLNNESSSSEIQRA